MCSAGDVPPYDPPSAIERYRSNHRISVGTAPRPGLSTEVYVCTVDGLRIHPTGSFLRGTTGWRHDLDEVRAASGVHAPAPV